MGALRPIALGLFLDDLGGLQYALGQGVVEVTLGIFGAHLERWSDLADEVDARPLVHRALGSRQRCIAVTSGKVTNDLGHLIDVAALQLFLMVLETAAPVAGHAGVGLCQHRHEVFEFIGRHRRPNAHIGSARHWHRQRHLIDDGAQNQVLLSLAKRNDLLGALHQACPVLGIDDRVALFELHSNYLTDPAVVSATCTRGEPESCQQILKGKGSEAIFLARMRRVSGMIGPDLPTPALVFDTDALQRNLSTMATALPADRLRPHVKAHKCTSLAAAQTALGHRSFTCATSREVLGMAAAGLGDDLLLANELVDPRRLKALGAAQDHASITIAVDSVETIDAAHDAGLERVLIDVNVGLPRCGCPPEEAGRFADYARSRSLIVRGVMGYEGHLMVVEDRSIQRAQVSEAMDRLMRAHGDVGGDVVSGGGTGTYDLHDRVNEIQAGSYALMDTHYAQLGLPFESACYIVGTVISSNARYAVADVGLKALGMDHGNPSIEDATVWFCSDEHITFAMDGTQPLVGSQVRVIPAHIDPTVAMHEAAWLVRGDEIVDRWPIDLRGW